MATVAYAPAQVGSEDIVAGTWANGFPAVQTGVWGAGLQYTVAAPSELLFRSLTLSLYVTGGGATGVLTVGLCNDLNEAVFSNTNLPSAQNTYQVYSATHTFVLLDTVTIPLDMEAAGPPSGAFVGDVFDDPMRLLGHSGFQGNIALVLTFTGGLVTFDITDTLTADQEPFLTGLHTGSAKLSRADWCPRCGSPMFREQFVKDGYTKGLVCPSCYDPPTRRRRAWRPPKEVNP